MTMPSTLTSRNLIVDKTMLIERLPAGWPEALNFTGSLRVDPPMLCEPNRQYRVDLDVEAGTARITEVSS